MIGWVILGIVAIYTITVSTLGYLIWNAPLDDTYNEEDDT